jgi:crotonobetainyl-CoA:carnitine CoA-transferase CaiB-like acyl-CoA transferase
MVRGAADASMGPGGKCQTKDGRWVAFTAPAQHLFERLCAMVGQPDLPRDPRYAAADKRTQHMPEFVRQVETWFAARTFAEAGELDTYQVPYSLIMSMADIFADMHYKVRQMIIDVPDPIVGALPQPAVVPKLSRTPGRITHAGPAVGAHTDDILSGLLGMSAQEIAQLRQEGVV